MKRRRRSREHKEAVVSRAGAIQMDGVQPSEHADGLASQQHPKSGGHLPVTAFEQATGYCAVMIADGIVGEVEYYFRETLPRQLADRLAGRAEATFEANEIYRRRISGSCGLAYIKMFMRHWFPSLLMKERPDLCRRLPPEFRNGERMPAGPAPRH